MKQALPSYSPRPRQQQILILLYRFRFLHRTHIQTLLEHKHHKRIIAWLTDLTDKQFIIRYYAKSIISTPAVYSLGRASRKYFKHHSVEDTIHPIVLNRVWRESTYSEQFRQHCLFLVDIYLSLMALVAKNNMTLHFYTKTDMYGAADLIDPAPDAYFAIEEVTGEMHRYFLDVFDEGPPKLMRHRVRRYIDYFESEEWQATGKPFPEIILICPNERLKKHLNLYIERLLKYEDEPIFNLSTWDTIKRLGLCRKALHTVNEGQ